MMCGCANMRMCLVSGEALSPRVIARNEATSSLANHEPQNYVET
jgi:hypothetical protein